VSDPALSRRAYIRAAAAGALLALVLDVLMLMGWHLDPLRQMGLLGSFYDIQGRALLHGHLAVPAGSLSFEGFVVGGHTYEYFGLVPALLRMPVLLITHALDGRLTQLSMLLAFLVLLLAGARLAWHVRELVRGQDPLSPSERVGAFLLSASLGAGAVPLFLASWPAVYHEAALWGGALTLAAVDAVMAVIVKPSPRRIAGAGLLALLAVNTRVSVGLAAVIALGLLAVRELSSGRSGSRRAALLLAAAVVAVAPAIALNEVRFHSAFGVPLDKQLDTGIDPVQHAFVAAYHGSTVGARFLPTTLLATVRPDAIGTVRAFPFIGLPHAPPTVVGHVRFNALLPSLSALTSMPLFCLLLVVGLVGLLRVPRTRVLLSLLIGAGAGFLPALSFGSTATRYLGDLLPFLFLGACLGMAVLGEWLPRRRRGAGRTALAVLSLLALLGLAVNGAVGVVDQGLLSATTTAGTRASFIRLQDDIDRGLGRRPHGVLTGTRLPAPGPAGAAGDLFVLGRCAGLYALGLGGSWLPVERTARSGVIRLRVRFPAPVRSRPAAPLVTLLAAGDPPVVVLAAQRSAQVLLSIRIGPRTVSAGAPVLVAPGQAAELVASIDPLGGSSFLSVRLGDGPPVASAPVPYPQPQQLVLGSDPVEHTLGRFGGTVVAVSEPTPVCRLIARRAHLF